MCADAGDMKKPYLATLQGFVAKMLFMHFYKCRLCKIAYAKCFLCSFIKQLAYFSKSMGWVVCICVGIASNQYMSFKVPIATTVIVLTIGTQLSLTSPF